MSALELVCHFMTDDNSRPWAAKDLRTIASLQATCKEARSIRDNFIEDRKSVAKAHKANMRKLKKHIGGYIYLASESASEYRGEEYFINPFTGEFDYADHRGAWNDDARLKYGDPLTVEEIEERDRMMRDKPLPSNMSHLVHHGLRVKYG